MQTLCSKNLPPVLLSSVHYNLGSTGRSAPSIPSTKHTMSSRSTTAYIQEKLHQNRLDQHWPLMADEIAKQVQMGRMDGKPKIRRGEDWRRSGHNRSCNMADQPHHHTPDHYLRLAQPLNDPSLAYALLLTPDGPTLWLHHVLLFGSAASVWSYNRLAMYSHHFHESSLRLRSSTLSTTMAAFSHRNTPPAVSNPSADSTAPLDFT